MMSLKPQQDLLSILSLMLIESNIVRQLSFNDTILDFANKKTSEGTICIIP